MSLAIEKLTEQVEMTKTAEEEAIEKLAETVNVIEQAQVLSLLGSDLTKLAEETQEELIGAIGEDLMDIGSRMGSALTKTASESDFALFESLMIAEDLNKIASVVGDLADELEEEDFNKFAETVIDISNEMTEDANAVFEEMSKEAYSTYEDLKKAYAAGDTGWGSSKKVKGKTEYIKDKLKEVKQNPSAHISKPDYQSRPTKAQTKAIEKEMARRAEANAPGLTRGEARALNMAHIKDKAGLRKALAKAKKFGWIGGTAALAGGAGLGYALGRRKEA